jgi:RHS repeat-associated protein
MTTPLKTSPKTASRALFLRKRGHFNPKKGKKNLKAPSAVAYKGIFFKKNFTGKEPDPETGLYYYGARYLDPKTSRWLSGDPALGEYLPVAPVNDEAKKRNGNLPGMGGVFNYVNLHAYHYAGNNPVKYVDPDGEFIIYNKDRNTQDAKQYVLRSGIHGGRFVEGGAYTFFRFSERPRPIYFPERHEPITLENGLNDALRTVLDHYNNDEKTMYKVEANAKPIAENVFEIVLTVTTYSIDSNGNISANTKSGVIGFVDNEEIAIYSGRGDRQRGINRIANEIVNIVLYQRREAKIIE